MFDGPKQLLGFLTNKPKKPPGILLMVGQKEERFTTDCTQSLLIHTLQLLASKYVRELPFEVAFR